VAAHKLHAAKKPALLDELPGDLGCHHIAA
jgi:hypothetical protein